MLPCAPALAAAAALAFALPAAPAAHAQLALEEVVVTARKRAETLQDVPIAVTAFTADDIERAGIDRPADFIGLMPNVTIVDTANVGDTQVSIRGIVSTRDAESTFAYVVDGVLNTNPNAFNETLLDVQQIEVLKGPQGALYGRNAVAGAILVTTAEPGDALDAKVRVGAGSEGMFKFSGAISGPLSDSLGGRLALSHSSTDGFYQNVFTGAEDAVDYLEDTSLRGRLLWEIGEATRIDLRAGFSDVSGGAINFNAVFALPGFATFFMQPAFVADVNDHNFIFAFNVPGENEQETQDLSLKIDHATDHGEFTAVLAYNSLEEYLLSDGTSAAFYGYLTTPACQTARDTLNSLARPDLFGPALAPFSVPTSATDGTANQGVFGPYTPTACDGYQYQARNQDDTSVELRFASDQDQSLRWIAGVYFAAIEREVVVAYGADQGQGFLRQPYVPDSGPNPTDLLFWDEYTTDVLALFGQLEWDINEDMEIGVALRFDSEDREVDNRVPAVMSSGLYFDDTPAPINPALTANDAGVLQPIPNRERSFEQLQPKLSWRWQLSDAASVYASYGVGFRSGGFNSLGTQATLDNAYNSQGDTPGPTETGEFVDAKLLVKDSYDKEVSTTFELGVKSELLDRRLRLNAALFSTQVKDNQFFEFFAGPFGLLRAVTTIEDVSILGAEADFNWLLGDRFSLHGGVGFLDSEIKENRHRPLSVGNDAPQAPDITLNLGGQYAQAVFGDWEFSARLDLQHVGKMWFHTLQGEQTPTIWQAFNLGPQPQDLSTAQRDAYTTVDLRLALSNAQWGVTLWGRNITDEEYLAEVIPAPEFGGSFIHPGPRDSWGLDLSYRY